MSTSDIPDTTGLTFEKVWFLIKENAKLLQDNIEYERERSQQAEKEFEKLREQIKQTDEQMKRNNEELKEQQKKTDEQMKRNNEELEEQIKQTSEQIKQTDKQLSQIGKQLGELGNRLGAMIECMVAPGLVSQFNKYYSNFYLAARNMEIKIIDGNKILSAEIDVILENDDFILCVEVKVTPDFEDLQKHIQRLKIAHPYFKKHRPTEKKIIGAVAGTVFDDKLKKAVIENGLYAITPSGNNFKIDVPEDFQPKYFVADETVENN
ncbi:MAG: hypothetical protein LBE18_10450 [Planctomycetaceae bacterium]|jgi:exonuclease VII large subunit|nr:hypothetical protein [Planctomycetaceae bacterium]